MGRIVSTEHANEVQLEDCRPTVVWWSLFNPLTKANVTLVAGQRRVVDVVEVALCWLAYGHDDLHDRVHHEVVIARVYLASELSSGQSDATKDRLAAVFTRRFTFLHLNADLEGRERHATGQDEPGDSRLVPSKPVDAPVRRRHTDGVTIGRAGHRDLAGARVVGANDCHGGTDRVDGAMLSE